MIRCTGMEEEEMPPPIFNSELEQVVGQALGTADLLGQMAADDYVEKLPVLYREFAEAAQFTKGTMHFVGMYSSAEDLMRKTPLFWENFARNKLSRDFGGMYRYLNDPYPDGPNFYLEHIEVNIERLRQVCGV
jgi:hypothetical protein